MLDGAARIDKMMRTKPAKVRNRSRPTRTWMEVA
jgi:hypothetical protein